MTDEYRERLPAGYSMEVESPNLLVLLRPDGTVVKRFVFSAMGPTPQALVEAAEEDWLSSGSSLESGERSSGESDSPHG